MRWWGLCVVGGFLLAQQAEKFCRIQIEGEKAVPVRIVLTGSTFLPIVVPDSLQQVHLAIPACTDTIRLMAWVGEENFLDTVIFFQEGQRDSLIFKGGRLFFRSYFSQGDIASDSCPKCLVVITAKRGGHAHALSALERQIRPEGLLAQQVREVPGVYLAGAGPLLQKPLLEGLGGTRITYLVEGVPLASQQWGEEHAPEIDPLSAEKLYLTLGSQPVRFGSEAVGGVLGVETPLTYEKPLTGRFALSGLTNGRGGILSTTLGGLYRSYAYRFQGTLSRLGTLQAPGYYLTGTASQQAHFSWHLKKSWERLSLLAHYSQYNGRFGLFQGSHVGNLSDLERALSAPTPLVTSTFTHTVQPPYQSTTHEITLVRLQYLLSGAVMWTATYARQYNRRSEWDAVGAYAQAGKPAIDLQLTRHSLLQEITANKAPYELRLGLHFHYERNYAQYAYFIPRYEKYQPVLYGQVSKGGWNFGARAEPLYWIAYQVPQREGRLSTGQYIPRLARWWPAWGAEAQRQWSIPAAETLQAAHTFTLRLAYLQRPPNAAELYAYGYHQGRAAFEIGQPTFRTENLFHLHLDWLAKNTYLCLSAYYSPAFIYARVDSPLVWIRGAALTYLFQQEPAVLFSLTGRQTYTPVQFLTFQLQGGALWASYWRDGAYQPLPLLPAPYIEPSTSVQYHRWEARLSLRLIARQRRYDPTADLSPPPPGYGLLSGEIQYTTSPTSRLHWHFILSGDNLLNQPYRQYPDLMRYFAVQMGRQVRLSVVMEF